ncbi:MAG: hypothetical protein HGB11_13745, partial [Chlorobiales bacterium]|nr:hypothetical protein [Chlorobiales bacterium]
PVHAGVDARFFSVFPDNTGIDCLGIQRFEQGSCDIIFYRSKKWAFLVVTVSGSFKILVNQPLSHRMHRQKPDFFPFTVDTQMLHPATLRQIFNLQPTKFFPAKDVEDAWSSEHEIPV